MTHKELTERAVKWLKRHSNNTKIPNCSTIASEIASNTTSGEIPDVLGWCYWTSVLIETKVSRSDFLRDFKKPFRQFADIGMGEFRYYICPKDLIKVEEVPEDWGLLYCNEKGKIETIKLANRQQANLQCERTILLSLVRRAKSSACA